MRKVLLTIAIALLVLPGAFAGGDGEESAAESRPEFTSNPYTEGVDLSGTEVNIFGAFVDQDADRFEASMIPFEEATGVDVVYEGSGDFETLITVRAEGGSPPDIAAFPQPGLAADLIRGGYVFDMRDWLGMDYLEEQYSGAWTDLAEIEGIQAGVWYRASIKSLVWYNIPAFEAEGYDIPETWDEMIALSDEMVGDGYFPWTIAIESSGATGWVATDWIEDIMLRIHPPEVYDEWVAGDLGFNSGEFKEALEYMAEIWFNEDYVLGGREGIVLTGFGDGITPLAVEPPAALMHRQANFIIGFMPQGGEEVGSQIGFFYLPPIDPAQGRPVLGAGDLLGAMQDRPEVRAMMRYLSTPDATRAWLESGGFVAPHRNTPLEWYPTEVDRGIAEILAAATTFRFDASDLMPGAVGAGTFWTGMTDLVNDPDADVDAILDSIDASFP